MNSVVQTVLIHLVNLVPSLLPKLLAAAPDVFVTILKDVGVDEKVAKLIVDEAISILSKTGQTDPTSTTK